MTSAQREHIRLERDRLLRERGFVRTGHDDTKKKSSAPLERASGDGCREILPKLDREWFGEEA